MLHGQCAVPPSTATGNPTTTTHPNNPLLVSAKLPMATGKMTTAASVPAEPPAGPGGSYDVPMMKLATTTTTTTTTDGGVGDANVGAHRGLSRATTTASSTTASSRPSDTMTVESAATTTTTTTAGLLDRPPSASVSGLDAPPPGSYSQRPSQKVWTSIHDRYKTTAVIGQGTYGIVYKGERRGENAGEVALKRARLDSYTDFGIPETALREVTILRDLHHENVMRLESISCTSERLYMVCEFLELDLKRFLRAHQKVVPRGTIKQIAYDILRGLAYCHGHRVMHRDLKPHNILLSKDAKKVKLADFGLARPKHAPGKTLTHEVVTLWYRPPELLLGHCSYTDAVDMWSVGCIVAEMLTGRALFPGDSEIDTLFKILRMFGTPSQEEWPEGALDPHWQFPVFAKKTAPFSSILPDIDRTTQNFLEQLLSFDPKKRLTAREALHHPWFDELKGIASPTHSSAQGTTTNLGVTTPPQGVTAYPPQGVGKVPRQPTSSSTTSTSASEMVVATLAPSTLLGSTQMMLIQPPGDGVNPYSGRMARSSIPPPGNPTTTTTAATTSQHQRNNTTASNNMSISVMNTMSNIPSPRCSSQENQLPTGAATHRPYNNSMTTLQNTTNNNIPVRRCSAAQQRRSLGLSSVSPSHTVDAHHVSTCLSTDRHHGPRNPPPLNPTCSGEKTSGAQPALRPNQGVVSGRSSKPWWRWYRYRSASSTTTTTNPTKPSQQQGGSSGQNLFSTTATAASLGTLGGETIKGIAASCFAASRRSRPNPNGREYITTGSGSSDVIGMSQQHRPGTSQSASAVVLEESSLLTTRPNLTTTTTSQGGSSHALGAPEENSSAHQPLPPSRTLRTTLPPTRTLSTDRSMSGSTHCIDRCGSYEDRLTAPGVYPHPSRLSDSLPPGRVAPWLPSCQGGVEESKSSQPIHTTTTTTTTTTTSTKPMIIDDDEQTKDPTSPVSLLHGGPPCMVVKNTDCSVHLNVLSVDSSCEDCIL